jgi:hypothetical protein
MSKCWCRSSLSIYLNSEGGFAAFKYVHDTLVCVTIAEPAVQRSVVSCAPVAQRLEQQTHNPEEVRTLSCAERYGLAKAA